MVIPLLFRSLRHHTTEVRLKNLDDRRTHWNILLTKVFHSAHHSETMLNENSLHITSCVQIVIATSRRFWRAKLSPTAYTIRSFLTSDSLWGSWGAAESEHIQLMVVDFSLLEGNERFSSMVSLIFVAFPTCSSGECVAYVSVLLPFAEPGKAQVIWETTFPIGIYSAETLAKS